MTVISDKGQAILADLPPYYASDPTAVAYVDTCARELQRIEDAAVQLRLSFFPQNADDTFGLLGYWEALFSLPVKPLGVPLSQRQKNILSHLRKRHSGAGSDWEAAVAGALDTGWTYVEDGTNYLVTITIPYAASSYGAYQVEQLVREITPAHMDVHVVYASGFQVGISLIGIDRL